MSASNVNYTSAHHQSELSRPSDRRFSNGLAGSRVCCVGPADSLGRCAGSISTSVPVTAGSCDALNGSRTSSPSPPSPARSGVGSGWTQDVFTRGMSESWADQDIGRVPERFCGRSSAPLPIPFRLAKISPHGATAPDPNGGSHHRTTVLDTSVLTS